MERLAKGLRVMAGLVLLLNLVAFFLPFTNRIQENYATLRWSQFDYCGSMLQGNLPKETEDEIELAFEQGIYVVCLMILPLLCSLLAGIYGVVGNSRQKFSGIMTFLISGMYILSVVVLPYLWPESNNGAQYERGIGGIMALACSLLSALLSVIAFAVTPRIHRTNSVGIPQLQEIKQGKIGVQYNIVSGENQKEVGQNLLNSQTVPAPNTGNSQIASLHSSGIGRGVLVGLSGIYAGAEIAFADGESIRLGRMKNNDLIFENQSRVSRNHCQIRWDAEQRKYSFRDYSSNGSFANGSEECLPQNIDLWLDPGTILAIGDDTNLFRLE